MNLSFSFNAAVGQMGSGSTAGNAGQLMSISGTINSTTESAAYWYDNLGRLVMSNQTTNGSSAQRKFGYDRWGNRTTVWPSVFGGSPIQTVTLEQSGGAPTNRITSVTNSGVTVNYSYDAAGNVTNDGVHAYQYDADNRLVSVDNGSTAQYKYDHQNRRVTKIIGSTWTNYVWQGGQVIGEHDATTAYTTNPTYQVNSARLDYVYSGSQRIYSRERASSGGSWTTKYYLSDRMSTRLVLDTSGNVIGRMAHLPFGEDFGESGSQEKHHFTSYERDSEIGTDYAINRQYTISVGRFTRIDPSSGTLALPQSLNRYAYVTDNPVNAVDPFGLFPIINLPPICPVVNGVAICGSLGSVNVSAGDGGTLLGGGSGVLSDFYVVDESTSETPEVTGGPSPDVKKHEKQQLKRFAECLKGVMDRAIVEIQIYSKDFDWDFTLKSMSLLTLGSILSGVVGVVKAAVLAEELVTSFATGAGEAFLTGLAAIVFLDFVNHYVETGKWPTQILDYAQKGIEDCVLREGVYLFGPVPGKDYIPLLPPLP